MKPVVKYGVYQDILFRVPIYVTKCRFCRENQKNHKIYQIAIRCSAMCYSLVISRSLGSYKWGYVEIIYRQLPLDNQYNIWFGGTPSPPEVQRCGHSAHFKRIPSDHFIFGAHMGSWAPWALLALWAHGSTGQAGGRTPPPRAWGSCRIAGIHFQTSDLTRWTDPLPHLYRSKLTYIDKMGGGYMPHSPWGCLVA